MTWLKVDDSFHSHPKVLAAPPAALGLWVVAGSWSSANLTDGFVPDHVLPRLLPDATELARQLVACGLWTRTRGGHRFHDWSDYQPTKQEATTARAKKSSGGALGNHRRWHVETGRLDPKCAYCQQKQPSDNRSQSDRISEGGSDRLANPPDPTRPVPIKKNTSSPATPATDSPEFVRFWDAYPRHIGKGAARRSWARAIKCADADTITAGADRFAAQCTRDRTETRFIPHPATWLNGERWADAEPATPQADQAEPHGWWDN